MDKPKSRQILFERKGNLFYSQETRKTAINLFRKLVYMESKENTIKIKLYK